MTKSFTVTLVLQLARANRLQLFDPTGKFGAGHSQRGPDHYLAQLAGMNSGVKNHTTVARFRTGSSPTPRAGGRGVRAREPHAPESPVYLSGVRYDYCTYEYAAGSGWLWSR